VNGWGGPSPKAIGVVAISVAVAGLLALMAVGLINKGPVTGKSGLTRLGKPAPEFTLPLFEGGELALSQHLGRPIVINFWASWCPPCREEAVLLERSWRSHRDAGVLFVGVDIQDTEEDARAFLRDFDITYPNGRDADGDITVDYGVIGLPVTFFVSRDGIVERRWVGALRGSVLAEWIEEMAAGAAPSGDPDVENLESFFRLDGAQ
jgi:cytochrome c biogenesis protein CcmG/thiol:disulfide interchange protein DsbE